MIINEKVCPLCGQKQIEIISNSSRYTYLCRCELVRLLWEAGIVFSVLMFLLWVSFK